MKHSAPAGENSVSAVTALSSVRSAHCFRQGLEVPQGAGGREWRASSLSSAPGLYTPKGKQGWLGDQSSEVRPGVQGSNPLAAPLPLSVHQLPWTGASLVPPSSPRPGQASPCRLHWRLLIAGHSTPKTTLSALVPPAALALSCHPHLSLAASPTTAAPVPARFQGCEEAHLSVH